jgi:RNA polymerase sigma-70 factor (ECF subfamily)
LLWLYRVAYHTLANHRRGEHRRDRLNGELAAVLRSRTPDDDPDDATVRVRGALATLRRQDRELLTLIAWEGLSPSEAATVLEISPGTVRVRLHRARSRLRNALEPAISDDAAPHPCMAPST